MFHNKPFKKDLTPFAKGGSVVKHVGKGAKEQSTGGGMASMTGGDPYSRMSNRYPKPTQQDLAPNEPEPEQSSPSTPPSPVPMGTKPPPAPTALMPSSGGDSGGSAADEEE